MWGPSVIGQSRAEERLGQLGAPAVPRSVLARFYEPVARVWGAPRERLGAPGSSWRRLGSALGGLRKPWEAIGSLRRPYETLGGPWEVLEALRGLEKLGALWRA